MSRRYHMTQTEEIEKCAELMPAVYNHCCNDGEIYQQSEKIRQAMAVALGAGKYKIEEFSKPFAEIAGKKENVEKLALAIEAWNDEDKVEADFLRVHRSWIGSDVGKYLEEYYRTELCLFLKLPMIYTSQCAACKKNMTLTQMKEAYACSHEGPYCTEACYDTLFADCIICGQKNMTCLVNQRTPFIKEAKLECACDACLMKKYGLGLRWIC